MNVNHWKGLTVIAIAVASIVGLDGCKKPAPERIEVLNDDFSDAGAWTYIRDNGNGYVTEDSELAISGGSLSVSLYQGEGCKRAELSRTLDQEAFSGVDQDSIFIRLEAYDIDYSALGDASLEFNNGAHDFSIRMPYREDIGTLSIAIFEDVVIQMDFDDIEMEPDWSSTASEESEASLQFDFAACGPDLYAGVDLTIGSLLIERKEVVEN